MIAKNDILRTIKMNDATITKELLLSLVAHHSVLYSKKLFTKTTLILLNRAVSLIWKDTFGNTPEFISNCF